jgi:uncharacterized membrane protein
MSEQAKEGISAAARNVEEIARLEREMMGPVPFGERISLAVTSVAGTAACAFAHLIGLLTWVGWNNFAPSDLRFDPYPFGLLTMIVSMEGVLLAILVLTAQNRMSAQTDRRDHLDLQVNLLAEQEMTMVLRLLSHISDHLGISPDDGEKGATRELMEQTNVYELMEQLRRKLT